MAGRQDFGDAEQRACRGRTRERAVLLDTAHRLAIEVAAQPAQTRLLARPDSGRREDRLLHIALDHAVPDERHVGAARASAARPVRDHAAHLREQRVPGRKHHLAAAAHARLGDRQQRDATVVDRLDHRFRAGLQDRHELVQRPHVELVEVARLAAHAEQVGVGVAEEVARAVADAQRVVEQGVRAADQVRATARVHRIREQDAEPVARLPTAGPEVGECAGLTVALDGEVLGSECVAGMHGAPILLAAGQTGAWLPLRSKGAWLRQYASTRRHR